MPRLDPGPVPAPTNLGPFDLSFSEIGDGNMERVLAERVNINGNRKRFFARLGVSWNDAARIRPSHSPNVDLLAHVGDQSIYRRFLRTPLVEADFDFYRDGADGLVTISQEQPISLITADCVPIAIWHPDGSVHGLVHAGLLPSLNGIVLSMAAALEFAGQKTSQLQAYLGPSISAENYDLSRSGLWEVVGPSALACDALAPLLRRTMSGTHIDLRAAIVEQLCHVGFLDANIQIFQPCTAARDARYYSNYAAKHLGGKRGGFCSVIFPKADQ